MNRSKGYDCAWRWQGDWHAALTRTVFSSFPGTSINQSLLRTYSVHINLPYFTSSKADHIPARSSLTAFSYRSYRNHFPPALLDWNWVFWYVCACATTGLVLVLATRHPVPALCVLPSMRVSVCFTFPLHSTSSRALDWNLTFSTSTSRLLADTYSYAPMQLCNDATAGHAFAFAFAFYGFWVVRGMACSWMVGSIRDSFGVLSRSNTLFAEKAEAPSFTLLP